MKGFAVALVVALGVQTIGGLVWEVSVVTFSACPGARIQVSRP